MLKDNLKTLRKNKGLSQEELSVKLNVVRQTVSKWEQGLSVPDAEMLISISEVFETPVSTILGENIDEQEKNDLKVISEKLEVINEQLSKKQKQKRNIFVKPPAPVKSYTFQRYKTKISIAKIDKQIEKVYMDRLDEVITVDTYQKISAKFETTKESLISALDEAKLTYSNYKEDNNDEAILSAK